MSHQIDLEEIKTSFQVKYEQTLYKFVEGDASIDYRKLLVAIIGKDT